ncbi:MAG: radical SAM protein [Gammaproteobacteria bacterium]
MYSPLRHIGSMFSKEQAVQLTFFVTRKCNARCPFCFYVDNTSNTKNSEAELSLDEIKKISSSLGKLLWLAFSGGEPYLRKDLVEISKVFYEQNKPVIMLFPTNGLMPDLIKDKTEQILKYCKNSVVTVKLSLDGLHGDHDVLRDTPGCFDKTMKTYQLLGELLERHANFELGINTVFCSENQDKMDEIIDFVQGMTNVKTHTISMVRGNLTDSHYKEVDYEKYRCAIDRLENNLKNRTSNIYRFRGARLKAAQDILQRRLIHQTLLDQKRLIPCYAGKLNLVLTEAGDVYPCEILSTSFGNVRDYNYNMKEVVHSEKARPVLESIYNKRCYCTHECYFITNILFNPRLYPALAREYVQIPGAHPVRVSAPPLRL